MALSPIETLEALGSDRHDNQSIADSLGQGVQFASQIFDERLSPSGPEVAEGENTAPSGEKTIVERLAEALPSPNNQDPALSQDNDLAASMSNPDTDTNNSGPLPV